MKKIIKKNWLFVLALSAIFGASYTLSLKAQGETLNGADVFAASCSKCHAERPPTERSDEKWQIIVTHMRVRASLTEEEAEAVLAYLQSNN